MKSADMTSFSTRLDTSMLTEGGKLERVLDKKIWSGSDLNNGSGHTNGK
eukprot:CAMPEP_0171527854 /NCGR_PEP_ID=MMETSP0959-20130129/11302_1 /TAXON_ID=87120 /ORGANISM="Aurantiochytrium limacinum, Strain ATCCMYA-1381" /LENGTH=48 /DNA_ID= /DNA_START= /DNA_END= /DNA_ORIENTATION=